MTRHLRRRIQRVPINARRNPTKRDAPNPILNTKVQRRFVATPKQVLALLLLAPTVDRTDRVRDVLCGKAVAASELCFACFGAVEGFALAVEGRTRGGVDRAVDCGRRRR